MRLDRLQGAGRTRGEWFGVPDGTARLPGIALQALRKSVELSCRGAQPSPSSNAWNVNFNNGNVNNNDIGNNNRVRCVR